MLQQHLFYNGVHLIIGQVYGGVVLQQLDQQPLHLILLDDPRIIEIIDLERNCIWEHTDQSLIAFLGIIDNVSTSSLTASCQHSRSMGIAACKGGRPQGCCGIAFAPTYICFPLTSFWLWHNWSLIGYRNKW